MDVVAVFADNGLHLIASVCMEIVYKMNANISPQQYVDLLHSAGVEAERPVEDLDSIEGLLAHSNLVLTAWHDDKLIGMARCLTDFYHRCVLSDLVVDHYYQRHGLGRQLQSLVKKQLKGECQLIALAGAENAHFFSNSGYEPQEHVWQLSDNDMKAVKKHDDH